MYIDFRAKPRLYCACVRTTAEVLSVLRSLFLPQYRCLEAKFLFVALTFCAIKTLEKDQSPCAIILLHASFDHIHILCEHYNMRFGYNAAH